MQGSELHDIYRKYFNEFQSKWRFITDRKTIKDYVQINCFSPSETNDIFINNSIFPIFTPTGKPFFPVSFKKMYLQGEHNGPPYYRYFLNDKDIMFSDVKYCPQCFKEQVIEHGFTWFKRDWMLFHANECIQHSRCLVDIGCNSCGWKNNRFEGIKSAMTGRCPHCRSTLWGGNRALRKKVLPSKIHEWFYNLLNAGLPHFSPNLRRHLLVNAYLRSGGSFGHSIDKMANSLFSMYLKMIPHDLTVNKRLSVSSTYSILQVKNESSPAISFWLPLISVFETFFEFKKYLDEVSVKFTFDYSKSIYVSNNSSKIGFCEGLCLVDEDPHELAKKYMEIY